MSERGKLALMASVFLAVCFAPISHPRVQASILEAFWMLQDYAYHHVLTCLIPAFFIAGAISVFVSQASVMKHFGAKANKFLSYGVASVSGAILAACSCTVLPIYAGISQRGAGIGPAVAFIFRHEEKAVPDDSMFEAATEETARPIWKDILYFFSMVCVLVFASHRVHWWLAAAALIALFWMLARIRPGSSPSRSSPSCRGSWARRRCSPMSAWWSSCPPWPGWRTAPYSPYS
ncbi:MAG: permease [Elusimicrobia bacterium]|nr:permease [Elusimicrobiota bacterium]